MRDRLVDYARSRAGAVLGVVGAALVAASDRLFGIPPAAERHIDTWGRD